MVQTLRHLVVFWDVSQNASHLSKALISLSNDGLAKKIRLLPLLLYNTGLVSQPENFKCAGNKMGAFFWPKHERTHWAKSSKIFLILYSARSLKITEKVSFNIASEASYGYILSGQKLLLKMLKMVQFLKTWKLQSNSVTRQGNFNWPKIDGKCQNMKFYRSKFG